MKLLQASMVFLFIGSILANQHKLRLQCRPVEEVLECATHLRNYVTEHFNNPETLQNCSRVLNRYIYVGVQEAVLLKHCAHKEGLLWLSELLYENSITAPRYKSVDDILRLARKVSAKIRSRLQLIVAAGVGTKISMLYPIAGQYSIPVAIAADFIQFGLEILGYEGQGKTAGAVGTTISGAMAGLSLAGPPGGAIGAGIGFFAWRAMEKLKDKALQNTVIKI